MSTRLKRIVVHLGPPKTGTSILQHTFAQNSDLLNLQGFVYPSLSPRSEIVDYATAEPSGVKHDVVSLIALKNSDHTLIGKRIGLQGADLDAVIEECRASFHRAVEQTSAHTMILSSESFGNYPLEQERHYEDLSSFLKQFSTDVIVILYARHPVSMIRSRYQHFVRIGHSSLTELNQRPWVYRYKDRIEQLWSSFGRRNVIVRAFGRDHDKDFDIISDFGRAVGLDSAVLKPAKNVANPGISMETAMLMDVLAKELPQPDSMLGSIDSNRGGIPRRMPGAPFCLSEDLEESVMSRSEGDLQFLKDNFGIGFPKLVRPTEPLWGDRALRALAMSLNHQNVRIRELEDEIKQLKAVN